MRAPLRADIRTGPIRVPENGGESDPLSVSLFGRKKCPKTTPFWTPFFAPKNGPKTIPFRGPKIGPNGSVGPQKSRPFKSRLATAFRNFWGPFLTAPTDPLVGRHFGRPNAGFWRPIWGPKTHLFWRPIWAAQIRSFWRRI